MNNNQPQSVSIDESLNKVIERVKGYNVNINPDEQIELRVDGLCENPGAMHIGLYARQGDNTLFAEHMFVGFGTCNEAEYIAVRCGLLLLQSMCEVPKLPVLVFSDSQLVTKQVAGVWRSAGKMQTYCLFLRKFRKTYPYELKKIRRTENEMADSLAQKYILKNSGRCMTIDNGRFNSVKQVPAAVKRSDIFNAIMSKELRQYLDSNNLNQDLKSLIALAHDGETDDALALADELLFKVERIFKAAPKTNEMGIMWMANTTNIIKRSITMIKEAVSQGNEVDLLYVIEELAGAAASGDEVFASQADMLREGYNPFETPATEAEVEEN